MDFFSYFISANYFRVLFKKINKHNIDAININTKIFVDLYFFQLFQFLDKLVYLLKVELSNKNSINSTLIILQLFLYSYF